MIDIKKILSAHKFLIAGCAITAGVHLGLGAFVFTPLKDKITLTKLEVKKLSADRENLSKELETLKRKGADIREKEGKLTEYFLLKSRLLDLSSSSDFLRKLVNYTGIKIELLRPGKKETLSQFVRWQINITASGNYQSIYGYLNYLETLPYILSVKKMEFTKAEVKGLNRINLTIEATGR